MHGLGAEDETSSSMDHCSKDRAVPSEAHVHPLRRRRGLKEREDLVSSHCSRTDNYRSHVFPQVMRAVYRFLILSSKRALPFSDTIAARIYKWKADSNNVTPLVECSGG